MNKAFTFFTLYIFSFISNTAIAADIRSIGVPYIQNYPKSVYQSGNQNWSVSMDENHIMYFGNSEGLLAFDGRYWQLYQMPNRIIVRAVAADGKGKVYAGGFGEFGYWAHNKEGKFTYTSLIKLIPEGYPLIDEIWKIYVDGDRVIFQSFSSIYIYQNGRISKPVKADQPFLFLLKAGKRFFVEVLSKGLFEMKGDRLYPLKGSESLANSSILTILPFGKEKYLIGTAKNGLFIYDGELIKPWKNQADEFLKTFQLNNGVQVLGRYFAFGTILNGVIILDSTGRVVQQINKSGGLLNNTILSLYADPGQNLWLGLDNGIDRIELNSPLYFYFDKNGIFGTVYSSIIHQDKIYLGTNQGLFYSELLSNANSPFQSFEFKLIPGSQGQVWDLSLIDGQLLCGHNEGTFLVSENNIRKISSINGGWMIKKLSAEPQKLIQGTYTGLAIYQKDENGSWKFSHRVEKFGEPSRFVEQDRQGQVWVSHAYKGVYKLTLSPDLKTVTESVYYDSRQGLPGSYHINVFNLENRIVFSSDSGFYIYDAISNRFLNYQELNKRLGTFAFSNRIIPAGNHKYWFIDHGKAALMDFSKAGRLMIDSISFSPLDGRMVQYYENISRIGSAYLISVDDGFAIYKDDKNAIRQSGSLPKVIIRKVENITDRIFTITENTSSGIIEIPFKQNNIRITFALPYYRQAKVRYQYFLEGYSNQWSEWSTQTQKEFTNLSQGDYQFRVRASVNGKLISDTALFEFTVLPPWYASNWAVTVYCLLLIGLIIIFRKSYFLKLKRHQEEIQQKMQQEKEEYLRQEALAKEQMIVKLKNEQLEAELAGKNRELANSAMNIVYKNELLQKIDDELSALKDSSGKKLSEEQLRKIRKVIDEGMSDERDWNVFEKSFNEAHENFFKRLKANYPDLVPNDLKLCAYLRLNMSSKEIASLLNISLRGVEIRRYRLRKKLHIAPDKNLVEFLIEF